MTTKLPSSTTWGDGYHYFHPHLGIEYDPPFDLESATDWERQEVRRYWRDAVNAAQELHRCAHIHLHDLYRLAEPPHAMLDGGGTSQPGYVATKLVVALTALRHVHDGMQHRLAVDRNRTASSAPEVTT